MEAIDAGRPSRLADTNLHLTEFHIGVSAQEEQVVVSASLGHRRRDSKLRAPEKGV